MATKTELTWEEFLSAGKEGQRWEYVDGEVLFMPSPTGGLHSQLVCQIARAVAAYQDAHPEWLEFATDTAFTMRSGNWRSPDWA